MVPASLIIFILITVTLAFPISLNSQKQRMLSIFERNQMLETSDTGEEIITSASKLLSREDRMELTSIVGYSYVMHGREPFKNSVNSVPPLLLEQPVYHREFTDNLFAGIGITPAYSYARVIY